MALVEMQAKAVIGNYTYGWPQLKASTQAQRVRLGYDANDPLFRSGDLYLSIKAGAKGASFGAEGAVYSTSMIAAYQEMGTVRIPPRSFLMASMIRCYPEAQYVFARFAESIFV